MQLWTPQSLVCFGCIGAWFSTILRSTREQNKHNNIRKFLTNNLIMHPTYKDNKETTKLIVNIISIKTRWAPCAPSHGPHMRPPGPRPRGPSRGPWEALGAPYSCNTYCTYYQYHYFYTIYRFFRAFTICC